MQKFKKKHRLIGLWISNELYQSLQRYLEKYCVGENRSERLRYLFYKLMDLESKGVTILKPKPVPEIPPHLRLPAKLICVKGLRMETKTDIEIDRLCYFCKKEDLSTYTACQELKTERGGRL